MGGCAAFFGILLIVPALLLCVVFPPAIIVIPLILWMLAGDAKDKVDEITHPRSRR